MEHIPVLLDEVLAMAEGTPIEVRTILDGTFGRGGHSLALLQKFENAQLLAVDRDTDAIEYGQENLAAFGKRIRFVHSSFRHQEIIKEALRREFDLEKFDLILLDLGVSSPQLDRAERGFSFYQSGPLDMRMDVTRGVSAAEIVNESDEDELIQIFQELGEVQRPQRVVRAIVEDRKTQPFQTTRELSSLIERVEGWRRKGHHPATKYFLALRLKVNEELDEVKEALPWMMQALNPGGRLMVITFHSLEDRIVKNEFKSHPELGTPVNKKVIKASWHDAKKNPRARSAQLRGFQRGAENESETTQRS